MRSTGKRSTRRIQKHLVGVWINAKGAEHEVMTAPKGVTLSDVAEKDGRLWLGSVELNYVGLAS